MSGIAPGSYFSFDISDKMGIDISTVGVNRNLELEEALYTNGTLLTTNTSMQTWRHGDSSDPSKSFTRSKYKCSHCGQVVSQPSCTIFLVLCKAAIEGNCCIYSNNALELLGDRPLIGVCKLTRFVAYACEN
jgi:hypothetical protein